MVSCYVVLLWKVQPYEQALYYNLDVRGMGVVVLTIYLAFLAKDNETNKGYVYTCFALMGLANLWFILQMLKELLSGYTP